MLRGYKCTYSRSCFAKRYRGGNAERRGASSFRCIFVGGGKEEGGIDFTLPCADDDDDDGDG